MGGFCMPHQASVALAYFRAKRAFDDDSLVETCWWFAFSCQDMPCQCARSCVRLFARWAKEIFLIPYVLWSWFGVLCFWCFRLHVSSSCVQRWNRHFSRLKSILLSATPCRSLLSATPGRSLLHATILINRRRIVGFDLLSATLSLSAWLSLTTRSQFFTCFFFGGVFCFFSV